MKEQGKEDYRLLAIVSTGEKSVKNVLCKIFLPLQHLDRLQIQLFPTVPQSDAFEKSIDIQLRAVLRNMAGDYTGRIQAKDLYFTKFSRQWGGKAAENVIIAEPTSLTIFEALPPRKDPESRRVTGRFWLTPSALLSRPIIPEYHHTGEVKIRRGKRTKFKIHETLSITLNYWHRYTQLDDEGVGTYRELVAEYSSNELKGATQNHWIQTAIECLDDFLLVSSFVARRRTVCTGWDFRDSKGWTWHYRRGITIPTTKKRPHLNEILIQPEHFKGFINQAYRTMRQLSERERISIRQALHYVIPREKRTLEMSYITFCSAIETLVSSYNETDDGGNIIPAHDWKGLRSDLKDFLKSHKLLGSNPTARKLLYEKLPELNRVAFGNSVLSLCKHYSVSLEHLWPVTDNDGGISLLGIRNKLIHGGTLTHTQGYALMAARDHLQWTIERLLLGFFNWPISYSTVSKEYLEKNLAMYKGWDTDRQTLSS